MINFKLYIKKIKCSKSAVVFFEIKKKIDKQIQPYTVFLRALLAHFEYNLKTFFINNATGTFGHTVYRSEMHAIQEKVDLPPSAAIREKIT